ncbi:MAG TPA: A24 family peptidase [Acidobacteriaceae bacterium]
MSAPMMAAPAQQVLFTGLALLCAGVASIYDLRERRIPNRLTGPVLLAGLLLHGVLGGWPGCGSSALAALGGGIVFLVFFLAGGMGAGDVKLMAAVGSLAGLASLEMVLLMTVLAGGVFAVVLATYKGQLRQTLRNTGDLIVHHGQRGFAPHPLLNLGNAETLRLPFALPIAAGCLISFCTLAWGAGA